VTFTFTFIFIFTSLSPLHRHFSAVCGTAILSICKPISLPPPLTPLHNDGAFNVLKFKSLSRSAGGHQVSVPLHFLARLPSHPIFSGWVILSFIPSR